MSGKSRSGASKDQDQMRDQEAFRQDPRGTQEVAEQQPESQQGRDGGSERHSGEGGARGGETGRDDEGEATGNPPNAG